MSETMQCDLALYDGLWGHQFIQCRVHGPECPTLKEWA